tara:strand:- start:49 stop:963 length:915 start_codon:yes stop_codon:yes gene_type:complete
MAIMTKNTHLEHPEDSILNGDLKALDWFTTDGYLSVKIDGAPAIVWGTNPATGRFFVGTKSVFNKKLIKINHDHEEIDKNHQGEVATILHNCLDYLPTTTGIFQGDFIGFGGNDCYKPNTITYYFQEKVTNKIIIAPHTYYTAEKDLRDAIAYPASNMIFTSNDDVLFVRPSASMLPNNSISDRVAFAKQIATLCDFPNDKQVATIKKQLNTIIREDIELDDLTLDALAYDNDVDINVLRLWKLVVSIKEELFDYINTSDELECYIEEDRCGHEGYVYHNEFGTFKIVNREGFSRANFNIARNW